jgi:hypothetical protein
MVSVVSKKLRDAIASRKPEHVEYLRVSIIDTLGRVLSTDYSIMHPTEPVDCIDRERSDFKESRIKPGRISRFKKLVIDESRIPPDR